MFLGLLIFICLMGLMGASVALTIVAVVVLTLVAGVGSVAGALDTRRFALVAKSIDSWGSALFGVATALAISVATGWLPGL